MKPSDQPDLIHANFIFVDGVGLSDPNMSTRIQLNKINVLQDFINDCDAYRKTPQENIILLPTGDGMCLGFLQGVDLPLKLAIQLNEKLAAYNKGKFPQEMINVRIGLHTGNFFTFTGLKGDKHFWGPGIIIAKRIMDLGSEGHILLSSTLAETLMELSDEYRQIIKPIRDYSIKHNITMLIYSAYGKNFGNPISPKKDSYQKSKMREEIIKRQNSTLYPSIRVDLTLKDDNSMLVQHKRTYEIMNLIEEPIKFVLHGIATDVEKATLDDLHLKVYDNTQTLMKISSINLDKPFTKEFSTVFAKPVLKGEKNRSFTLEYEVEEPERYYENTFSIGCKKLIFSFTHGADSKINTPTLYNLNLETNRKTKTETKPIIEKSGKITLTWEITDVVKGQTFRIEW